MFSDESTFMLVRVSSKIVRRLRDVSRFDPRYMVKTMKHPDSVIVRDGFSDNKGRGELYFLPKNLTVKGSNYIDVMRDQMLDFRGIHECDHFMHDLSFAHKFKQVETS